MDPTQFPKSKPNPLTLSPFSLPKDKYLLFNTTKRTHISEETLPALTLRAQQEKQPQPAKKEEHERGRAKEEAFFFFLTISSNKTTNSSPNSSENKSKRQQKTCCKQPLKIQHLYSHKTLWKSLTNNHNRCPRGCRLSFRSKASKLFLLFAAQVLSALLYCKSHLELSTRSSHGKLFGLKVHSLVITPFILLICMIFRLVLVIESMSSSFSLF